MTSLHHMYLTRLIQVLPETNEFVELALGYFANVQCCSNGAYSYLMDSVLLNLIRYFT